MDFVFVIRPTIDGMATQVATSNNQLVSYSNFNGSLLGFFSTTLLSLLVDRKIAKCIKKISKNIL